MTSSPRPGDANWQPDPDAASQTEGSGRLLRILSVVPFVLAGAVGVIAAVSWLLVLVLGVGIERGPVWSWAAGRAGGEVLSQILLLLLIGAGCLVVVAVAMAAATLALRREQPGWFWPLAEGIFAILLIGLVVAWTLYPQTVDALGLSARDWYFAMGVVAFSMVVLGMRGREERRRRLTARARRKDG